jgi:hypothetical protein
MLSRRGRGGGPGPGVAGRRGATHLWSGGRRPAPRRRWGATVMRRSDASDARIMCFHFSWGWTRSPNRPGRRRLRPGGRPGSTGPTELASRSTEARVRLNIATELTLRYGEARVRLNIATELTLRPSERRVRLGVVDVRRSTFDVRRSTFDVRRSTFDVRRATCDSRPPPRGRRHGLHRVVAATASGASPPPPAPSPPSSSPPACRAHRRRPVQPASPGLPRGAVSPHPPPRRHGDGLGDGAAEVRLRPVAGRTEDLGCAGRPQHHRRLVGARVVATKPSRAPPARTAPRPARPSARSTRRALGDPPPRPAPENRCRPAPRAGLARPARSPE